MPEMTFTVRWPDGEVENYYSPSLVIHDYLDTGHHYTVSAFSKLTSAALSEASERVRQKYGMTCTSAMETTRKIAGAASRYPDQSFVDLLNMQPPLSPEQK